MKITNLLITILFFSALHSCISTKKIKEYPLKTSKAFSFMNLNGSFDNSPSKTNQNGGNPLNKFLFTPFKTYEWQEFINLQGVIKIKTIKSNKLDVQLWKSDSLICEKQLKGKSKNGYFELRRKLKIYGIPFLYFVYKERKILLSINEEGNLILKEGNSNLGNILIITGGDETVEGYEFKRISN